MESPHSLRYGQQLAIMAPTDRCHWLRVEQGKSVLITGLNYQDIDQDDRPRAAHYLNRSLRMVRNNGWQTMPNRFVSLVTLGTSGFAALGTGYSADKR